MHQPCISRAATASGSCRKIAHHGIWTKVRAHLLCLQVMLQLSKDLPGFLLERLLAEKTTHGLPLQAHQDDPFAFGNAARLPCRSLHSSPDWNTGLAIHDYAGVDSRWDVGLAYWGQDVLRMLCNCLHRFWVVSLLLALWCGSSQPPIVKPSICSAAVA